MLAKRVLVKDKSPPFFGNAPIGHGSLLFLKRHIHGEHALGIALREDNNFFSGIHQPQVLFGDFVDVGGRGVIFIIVEFLEVFFSKRGIFFFKIVNVGVDLIIFIHRDREVVQHVRHHHKPCHKNDAGDVELRFGVGVVGHFFKFNISV